MEDASEAVPCSVSESCGHGGVLLPAAAVLAAMMPAVSQPAVLSVVSGQSGVSVSSVCDSVVLASSVVEEMKEELHHGRL